jgi:hypothetical protein
MKSNMIKDHGGSAIILLVLVSLITFFREGSGHQITDYLVIGGAGLFFLAVLASWAFLGVVIVRGLRRGR